VAFLLLLTIPLLFAVGGFILLKGVTWKEFLVQVTAQILVAGASAAFLYFANTSDTEIWNAIVTGKKKVWVPCSHSYSCHCHEECSGSGENEYCSEECDTCYEHFNDWDWDVYNSIGETIEIDRVDRQGSDEPPRWTTVTIGEPTSTSHWYKNYIKAAPGTLFKHQGFVEQYRKYIPPYPSNIYDYYRLDRLVLVNGVRVDSPKDWNVGLAIINSRLGHYKQANLIIVLVKNLPSDYFYALEEAWIGGKKNDSVLVIGVDAKLIPKWARVMSWTQNELFRVKLRDDIIDLPILTRETVLTTFEQDVVKYYKRKPMAEFEYLQASITPSVTELIISFVIGIIIALGLTYFFNRENIFNEE
jgi:hypothetical protein